MRSVHCLLVAGALTLAAAAPAASQSARTTELARGTAVSGFAGVAGGGSQTGPLFGGSAGWDLTPLLSIEGSGSWIDFAHRANGFAAALKLRVKLTGHHTVVPFVQGGIGMYRATFAEGETIRPDFYRRRHARGPGLGAAFTDPTVVAGGGLTIALNRRMALRPALETMVAMRNGRTRALTSVAVHAVFVFEDHPVTPGVR